MNKLSQFLVESILGEADSVDNIVVVYAGRFQPFHKGHYATYSHLVKKFGKNNVYIGTSNKTDNNKSPFNFKEKVMIITKMFGIPKNKIVQVKNPYVPTEVLKKFDKDTTAFVTVVGKKDASRLGGKFFTPYKDGIDFEGYEDRGYVYIAPEGGGGVSGTEVRKGLSSGSEEDKKKFFTKRAYPKFNQKIFDFITNTLSEDVIPKEVVEGWLIENVELIKEASQILGAQEVDDGPNYIFPNFQTFDRVSKKRAEEIGYTVLSQIMSAELTDIDPHPIYPNGPVKSTSPFPAGVAGKTTATNQKDYYGVSAYNKWLNHVTRTAALVGYSIMNYVDLKTDKKQSTRDLSNEKKPQGNVVSEDIKLPVNVGDTILTGRFKNKKTVVKTIGKDEHGMPTINGRKVVNFRILKEGIEIVLEDETFTATKKDTGKTSVFKSKDARDTAVKAGTHSKKDDNDDESSDDKKPNMFSKDAGYDAPDVDKVKKQQSKEEPKQDNWEKVDDKNNYYKSVRKYTDEELEDETGEYYENETTMKTAPNAFKDKADMIEKMKNAKAVYLPSEKMENMNNTDMGDILNSDNPKQTAKERADEYGKDISWQYGSMEKNEKVPAPIALRDKNGEYHLVAGNTRAMAFTAAGKKLPIKVIDYDGEFQYQNEKNESVINEIPMADLQKIDKYADKQLNPVDVVLTDKHFFDRLTDPRNKKPISQAELIGFFKRLGKKKKDFLNFLQLYGQIVAKDNRSKINIPFMKQANKVIAKTVMRKDDFKTSSPEYNFEQLAKGMDIYDIANMHKVDIDDLNVELQKGIEVEKEHTSDKDVAKKIALDHLYEDPKYYTKLATIEEEVNSFFYMDFKKWAYKNRAKINRMDYEDKVDFLSDKYMKDHKKWHRGESPDYIGAELVHLLVKDRIIKEGLAMGYPDQKWLDDHEKKLKKLRKKFDKEKLQYNEPFALGGGITESLILEGGAYGHMNHPFDTEINLTFGQLKDIVNKALEGNLELTREKTDGQALAVSWRDGRLVAARNKGHLKNKGAGALDINGVAMKFAGRGELEKAYNFAMRDLTKAISKLSEKQREKIFKGGACFMNLEVIYPTSVNVIPYGQALLVFHGTMEYNEDGIAIGENQDAAKILAGMIKQVNQDVQSAYTIQGPPVVQLPKSKNLSSMKGKYNGQISKLQSKFKLKDTDGIADYHQAFWMDFVNKKSPSKLDNKTLMGLVKRWAFYDKSFRLDKKNITDEKTLEWAKGIDKNDHAKMAKDNIRPFEDIFLGLGAEVLQFMSSALTVNPDKAVRDMKKRLDKTISDVKKSGDPKKVSKLKLELERLNSIGGSKKIVPNEGIVFVYGGKTFKLTGTFAPLNQILGLFYE